MEWLIVVLRFPLCIFSKHTENMKLNTVTKVAEQSENRKQRGSKHNLQERALDGAPEGTLIILLLLTIKFPLLV